MKCVFCNCELKKHTQTIERRLKNRIIYINNVPVDICISCGEVYIDDSIVTEMNNMLNRIQFKDLNNVLFVDFNEERETNFKLFSPQQNKLATT
ncbi:MAG: hypothetical protein VR72_06770 [Clostridiaceae bacterium BRH_c20a]|nr:MAG: hypothetical protein VR72_06770 [Clostridiaceae bacterium BRH_c20a]